VAGGRLDIAMRYVRGAKLAELLSKYGSLGRNTRWALGILGPVAGALDTAHDAGLVHRDVKPSRLTVNRWLFVCFDSNDVYFIDTETRPGRGDEDRIHRRAGLGGAINIAAASNTPKDTWLVVITATAPA